MPNRNYPPEEAAYWKARQDELSGVGQNTTREIDVDQMLRQQQLRQPEQRRVVSTVKLKTGSPYYKVAQGSSGFGISSPIAIFADRVRPEQANMEFMVDKQISCFIVENHDYTKAIDTTNLPKTTLIAVQTPFTGTVLVHESSLVIVRSAGNGQQQGGNNLLKG